MPGQVVKARTAAAAALAALFLAGCGSNKVAARPPSATPVVAATAERRDVPVQLTAIGSVEPYSTVSVKSNIGGQVMEVHFREGDFVRKGQLLFTIDKRPYEAALHQAEGNLARDQAQAANAEAQSRRYEALQKQGVVASEQADTMISQAAAMQALVQADKAAVENARVQLEYCSITSPIDGRTGNLAVKAGNLVKANDNPILVTINQIIPIYATFTVPEQYLPEIKQYMQRERLPVSAGFPNSSAPPAAGALTFIDNAVDQATGTIRLKGTFPNTDRRLWPGQFVNVALTLTTQRDATVIPSQALQTGQKGTFVFVVKPDMTAETRPVTVGQNLGGTAVITGGIRPGERVVTDGQLRLAPGATVEFRDAVAAPGAGNSSVPAQTSSRSSATRQKPGNTGD
jgi:multidrug efflux system membrane fusion protein